MKRLLSFFLCLVLTFTIFTFDTKALEDSFEPYVIDFEVIGDSDFIDVNTENNRTTGLISAYGLSLSKTGTTLKITGATKCVVSVVKCGFKDLTVQRRKSTAYDWEDYYEYGNVYVDNYTTSLSTTLAVASGYQYRVTCEHYAKKNILQTEKISNTTSIVTV